jgi:hypothetical protein
MSMAGRPSLVRRNHGTGHTYELDGAPAPGITHLIGKGFPKGALPPWTARTCAQAVLDEWPELERMPPSERYERVRTAPYRDRDAAARRGSEVHRLAQRMALHPDEDVPVPEELVGHVDSYLRFAREWEVREVLVEAVIAKREPRYCGTLDLVADLADGRRWLLDWKTTRSGVFSENALQLAAYRYADFYVDAEFHEQPMPPVDACGVVWLRADGYDLHPVTAGLAQWRLFLMVARIARLADRELAERFFGSPDDVIGAPVTPPVLVDEAITE